MTEPIKIDFSLGWQPDWNPGDAPDGSLAECKNLYPEDDYYKTAKDKVVYSTSAVTGTPLLGKELRATNGSYYPFLFTTTKIYRMASNGDLTDVTRSASAYTAAGDNWSVVPYGNWVIATNGDDVPQVLKDMSGGTNFVALGGTPPYAKYALFHSGYLVFANLIEGSTAYPSKVRWSALESVEDWTASLTTGSDAQDLADADGDITGMTGVGGGIAIFHEDSITYAQFIGAPYTFSFKSNVVSGIGAYRGTPINVNGVVYFWGKKDIYVFDGQQAIPIGEGVRRTVLANLDINNTHRITSCFDKSTGIIMWSYPSTASDGTPDKILCYNVAKKRFSHIDIAHHCLFSFRTGGYSSIDADAFNLLYGESIDAFPDEYDIDSAHWLANAPSISVIDTVTAKAATLTGSSLTNIIETSEKRIGENNLYIYRVRPNIINKSNVDVTLETRSAEDHSSTTSTSTAIGSNDYADVRATGRFAKVKFTMGDHDGIISCDVYGKARGNR